jgi:hypothetical protein
MEPTATGDENVIAAAALAVFAVLAAAELGLPAVEATAAAVGIAALGWLSQKHKE